MAAQDPARNLIISSDLADLSRRAASLCVAVARRAVEQQGRFSVCLSGGFTPRNTYALLACQPFCDEVPWRQVHIFWGDERCIPADHPDNHYRMASDLLLSKVPIPAENIHRMRGEAANPELAAREYETFLERFFDLVAGDVPRFDLILLGMGADGHTASLFPGTAALNERQRLVVANFVPTLGATRLTLTVPILNNARQVLFLVAGKSKAGALSAVLADKVEQQELPASVVRPEKGEVHWLVDEAAASKLCLGSGSGGLGVRIP